VNSDIAIRIVPAADIEKCLAQLSSVLIDCVEGGASVSFMAPLSRARAEAFWRGVKARVAAGTCALIIAELEGHLVGTVQNSNSVTENQPHRADLAKMLVHRKARRRGIGRALILAAEDLARSIGKTLLVLDTVTGSDAERLYTALGWKVVGVVPNYALFPDGRPCDTTIFYKQLTPAESLTSTATEAGGPVG
jgi:GNAT superfamily N-acetyltransferase